MGEYSSCIIGDTAGVMGGDLSFVRKETHLCHGRKPVLSHQKKLFLYNWRRHSLEEIHSVSLEETPVLWEDCFMYHERKLFLIVGGDTSCIMGSRRLCHGSGFILYYER